MDDIDHLETDTFERLKPFQPKKGTTKGPTNIIPIQDNDTKLFFYDVQGESVYTNPPDSNAPTIDHGLDEEHIWAFQKSAYNQISIKNQYVNGGYLLALNTHLHQPHWGEKLQMPAWFKEEKMEKFFKHWQLKLGLENIKMRQALDYIPNDKQ